MRGKSHINGIESGNYVLNSIRKKRSIEMEILELSKWISEEKTAIEFLRKKKILKDYKKCPHYIMKSYRKLKDTLINIVIV